MPSVREQILVAFFNELKTLETSLIKVVRNPDKAMKVLEKGAIITLQDGESGEPEMLLSPLTYIYEHIATIELVVNTAYAQSQGTTLDDLLMIIENLILADRTLGGLAEWVEARAPEFIQEAVEGAPAMRAANVNVMMRFHTASPLH
jgi:hypothetical protein